MFRKEGPLSISRGQPALTMFTFPTSDIDQTLHFHCDHNQSESIRSDRRTAVAPYGAPRTALPTQACSNAGAIAPRCSNAPRNRQPSLAASVPDSTARCPGHASEPVSEDGKSHIPQRPTLGIGQHQAFHGSDFCSNLRPSLLKIWQH